MNLHTVVSMHPLDLYCAGLSLSLSLSLTHTHTQTHINYYNISNGNTGRRVSHKSVYLVLADLGDPDVYIYIC